MEGPARPSISVHIPVALLSMAVSVYFISQLGAARRTSETIEWQMGNTEKQLTSIKEGQSKLGELITQREGLVKQSTAVQEQYTQLFNEVLDLAKTDDDAKKVVEKWKIQRAAPPEGEKKAEEGN